MSAHLAHVKNRSLSARGALQDMYTRNQLKDDKSPGGRETVTQVYIYTRGIKILTTRCASSEKRKAETWQMYERTVTSDAPES